SLFPSAALVGSDGDALMGGMPVGRLAWVLGADREAISGYQDLFSDEEALEFARAAATGEGEVPEGALVDDLGVDGLDDLGGLDSVGLDASAFADSFGGLTYVAAPRAGAAPAIGATSALGGATL